ncbi:MAG: DUF2508 family protein [Ruminiclostridium sp.]|nr:DUF2508 family protein [Ruminiclostridium sp.]
MKKEEILTEIAYLRDRLEKLNMLFNMAETDDETESLIYEEKAVMLRYYYVIREAKKLGITAERTDKEWLKL